MLGVYRRIECYLDNDDAGRRTLERLRAYFGEKVIDRSSLETFARQLVCILFVNSLYNRKLFCIFEY
ncbi:hypothetical protein PGN_1133 [Porphyromonas gingivalis ATCC 33277]|uniref:Toprim domain-containing protein n=1 Tax=Porphyromonas gingivalis (strain ATCC 33277 / DSM 20709 / CIP 103683 / JCM 12257 / NCTC 11834 / 2561) TaxID=431947 RepID=B2RJV7_PORG3|nr:hypothetical protein PGN_1133 [Porphyromonas gingivalis ATCC 33277]